MKVLVLGAAGGMSQQTVRHLATNPDIELTLADLDHTAVTALSQSLPRPPTTTSFDLFDRDTLLATVDGHDLVVNGAGPFYRTFGAVADACMTARVHYIDLSDDVEATRDALTLDRQARDRGISILPGCGVSPGITNVVAGDLIGRLDEAHTVDVLWCTGDEGEPLGPAVLDHAMHMVTGTCPIWRDGAAVDAPAFQDTEVVEFAAPLGEHRTWLVAHPETVTLPRSFPQLRDCRCLGALDPVPVNGLLQGIADAAEQGTIERRAAIEFLAAITGGKTGSLRLWPHALRGIRAQRQRDEVDRKTVRRFFLDAVRGRNAPFVAGFVVRATGVRDGSPITLTRRAAQMGATTPWTSMSAFTGLSLAAFVHAFADHQPPAGALAPEQWAPLDTVERALARFEPTPLLEPDIIEELESVSRTTALSLARL